MAVYYTKDTKLTPNGNQLFDIKSKPSSFGHDIDLSYSGEIRRIIGIDKLEQNVKKVLLVKKGSYNSARTLGVSFGIGMSLKNRIFLNSEIRESLATYANLQQQNKSNIDLQIVGKNIYRTVDILNPNSWKKLNSHIITSNAYNDYSLVPDTYYYYRVTTVYKDIMGSIFETGIDKYESIMASNNSTLSAKVNDSFVLINNGKSAILYWSIFKESSMEEQLRSIINIIVAPSVIDPRSVNVNLKLSNRELTQTQINLLRG